MKKTKIIIGIILLLISSMVSAQDELHSYLKLAAENNPGLKARFSEYMAALEIAPQVKALPDPQVAFAYFIMPVETRMGPQQAKISASQMFPWFGTLKAKENVAIQSAKAKYEQFEEAKSRLFNDVRSNYFNIYFNKKAIQITIENIDILHTFRKLANIKFESGLVSAVDEYRIEMEIGDLENQLYLLIDTQNSLEFIFKNLLNIDQLDINTPETLWVDDFPLNKENILDSIGNNNHQLLTLSIQQEELIYRKELAENQGKPDFSIGLDYIFVGTDNDKFAGTDAFVFPKIGITIPLYRKKYKAMVNEVVHLQTAKEFEKSDKENILVNIFENVWKDYLDADRRIDLYHSQLELASKSIKLIETDYATGNKNFEEILRMERKLLTYSLKLEKSRSDKQAAISFINYLMGN
ncbi:MAG: TolC family protein [Bacteroidetes bacterium]|nr:TolC family protein [Bacteroidota bacterium]